MKGGDNQQTRQVNTFLKGRQRTENFEWAECSEENESKRKQAVTKRKSPSATKKPTEMPDTEFVLNLSLNPLQRQWRKSKKECP